MAEFTQEFKKRENLENTWGKQRMLCFTSCGGSTKWRRDARYRRVKTKRLKDHVGLAS